MSTTELFELVAEYTVFWSVVGFAAIGLFVWLPLWWVVTKYFGDERDRK